MKHFLCLFPAYRALKKDIRIQDEVIDKLNAAIDINNNTFITLTKIIYDDERRIKSLQKTIKSQKKIIRNLITDKLNFRK